MVPLNHLHENAIGIFGLARSGLATAAAAKSASCTVFAFDDREEQCAKGASLGAIIAPPADWPWADLSSLVLAPGVPLTHPEPHPVVDMAQRRGIEIICDIELFYRELRDRATFVAITGTNGKSTTTALIGHVLKAAGRHVQVGGNIGTAAFDLEPPTEPDSVYVLEMSSYQLDLTSEFKPAVAIWLNLTPDHLERHGTMAGYRAAKERIYLNQTSEDTLILGLDEPDMEHVHNQFSGRKEKPNLHTVSVTGQSDCSAKVDDNGSLQLAGIDEIVDLSQFGALRGRHNWQNAAAAFLACQSLGLSKSEIISGLASFGGLVHRLEILERIGKVLVVNDSKATNVDAAARALETFSPIYWIAGGRCTDGGIEDLRPYFSNVAKAFLIGESADDFSRTLSGDVPHTIAGDLATAVSAAIADASLDPAPEPTVLLSPAAKSFDQFADFEVRGEAFRDLVTAIGGAQLVARAGKHDGAKDTGALPEAKT